MLKKKNLITLLILILFAKSFINDALKNQGPVVRSPIKLINKDSSKRFSALSFDLDFSLPLA